LFSVIEFPSVPFSTQAFSCLKPFHAVGGSCPILGLHPDRAYQYSFGGLCHLGGSWAVGGFAPKEALPFLLEALPWFSLQ
jgi:hypothetical protein